MLRTELLPGNFGVVIHGVDAGQGLDDASFRALTEALYAHRVVVLKDQRFDEASYLAFGRRWGAPIPHVLDHMHMPGYPELMTVGNTEVRDRDAAIRNGAALWHTDQSYEAMPASATMLYSLKTPDTGGQTRYCDMVQAYEDLDAATKARVDDLNVAHAYGAGKRRAGEVAANPLRSDEQRARAPVVHHPLVLCHPVTGHKALYALGHGAYGIEGMDVAAGEALLDEMKDHVLQDKYFYAHDYEVGELVIWDTLSTMHAAVPIEVADGSASERLLWRISVRGRPEVHAQAA